MCLDVDEMTVTDNLTRPIGLEDLNPTLWSDKCDEKHNRMHQPEPTKLQPCSSPTQCMQLTQQFKRNKAAVTNIT